jgi:hypothetical protein
MSRKKPNSGSSGLVQVVVSLAIIAASAAATAGTGQQNGVPSPRPPTVCAQLRVLFQGSRSVTHP